ncbi:MAG: recombinase family protein [Sandaracinobacter sp.]
MRMIGYARSAPLSGDLDGQRQRLAASGCELVFEDQAAGLPGKLPGLEAALSTLRPGDVLVVCSLDRLGQSVQRGIKTILNLNRRNVGFRSLREDLDLVEIDDALLLRVLEGLSSAASHLELERRYAANAARAANQSKPGRKHKLSEADVDCAVQTVAAGAQTVAGMAKLLGVGRNTLSRALNRRPDYFRLTKAQIAEAERLADEICASADRMAQRLDNTIAKIDRIMSPEYIAERERAIREELEASPFELNWDALRAMRQAEGPA